MKFAVSAALSILSLVGLSAAAYPYDSDKTKVESEKPLALNEVNIQFRKDYADAKHEIRDHLGSLILCINDDMILQHGKERSTINFIKPHYTGLKEVSHITLDTFVLLTNHTGEKLSSEKITRLEQFKLAVLQAAPKVKTDEGLSAADDPREDHLIEKSVAFLSHVIERKEVSKEELRTYVRETAKPDLENAYEAAGSQITVMDNALGEWRKQLTADEWQKLHVIIVTHHMPRQELLAFQYFQKVLNQKQEGERIIVAETTDPMTEEQAIDLLLTHILDGKIATEFFDDPWRMHRDLLADGAKKWLETHPLKAIAEPR
ncbi:MAG TPA: hypothetical protein V6C76_06975 [Drouetiella sp.]